MKKTLALILAIVMVFAFATTAFAVHDNIVGNFVNGTGSYEDGVPENQFTSDKLNTATIAITATAGAVNHRYAVDIEYDALNFVVASGSMQWDVNSLDYVRTDANDAPLADVAFPITVTNRSDLPVYLNVVLAKVEPQADDGLTLALYQNNVAANQLTSAASFGGYAEIAKNLPGTDEANVQKCIFTLGATSQNWDKVVNYYADKAANAPENKYTLATLSITVSKNAP